MNRPLPRSEVQDPVKRIRLDVSGAVQGVGFRPFVHRLAVSEGLGGLACNTAEGAQIEVEGPVSAIDRFVMRLHGEIDSPARIARCDRAESRVQGTRDFRIVPSVAMGRPSATVLPDLAACPECLREIFDPADRRFLYPFTTCVRCGPRYSIIESLPYDRERTAMHGFEQCEDCRREYDDPASRRFHAQTNACSECGPQLSLWDADGTVLAERTDALEMAAAAIRAGRIVALKGLGGFQLLADAGNDETVRRLRDRKRRPAKPFAVMAGTLAAVRDIAVMSAAEERLLGSAAAPIVLLRSRCDSASIAPSVTPGNPLLGVMLPYTPLHHLLLRRLGFPIVATSGNRGSESIVTDERNALDDLSGLADLFLVHNRPILRPVDDSVVRLIAGDETVLRLARGYAPLTLPMRSAPLLAVGGHQKCAVAVAGGTDVSLGPHIGDLDSPKAREAFACMLDGLTALYGIRPEAVASDRHPDYHSSRMARTMGRPLRAVPHHLAHILAAMLENGLDGPVLGFAWDGTGYGEDGLIRGSECLVVDRSSYRRAAHLRAFRLPGGEAAIREPRRCAAGLLHALFGGAAFDMNALAPVRAFTGEERRIFAAMLERGVNAPWCSSVGRMFDAVAALLDLRQTASFEGEAAMAVEFAAARATGTMRLPVPVLGNEGHPLVIDWHPLMRALVEEVLAGRKSEVLAAAFHEALVGALVAVALRTGIRQIVLTGGCFQNARLTERAVEALRAGGFDVYWHHRIPPNDGGLAVGQAVFAAHPLTERIS